ncbi:TIR-like protein FxsC [Streptomyces sp. NPDC048275]|uniref:TIR-like protein FxsC n=1 Tax=Streptomyces sp. NPDC048275 TaxID=3155629 RepID=UPI0033C9DAA2
MPEEGGAGPDSLARAVAALSAAAPEFDATALADVLWLASRVEADADDVFAAPSPHQPAEAATAPEPEGVAPPPVGAGRTLHERLDGASSRVRGDPVAAARASGLPLALEVTRALRPWKRPWRQGRRSALDVDATVDDYARSGELLPVFTPAPERWFDLVLVVDRSPAMRVWRETIADLTAILDRLGAFRTLQVRGLGFGDEGLELRDGQGRLMSPGQLRSPDGRRLVVAVSDCAAPAWRDAAVWRQLRDWALSTPVALLNPLPLKLWRRTGLDLPTVRVSNGVPGSANSRLDFDPPPLLPLESDSGEGNDWLPIPVLSMSPNSLNRWSSTLMRTAPHGCGAVLVPQRGRPEGRAERGSQSVTAKGFLNTASPPAARLAVLCSAFDRLSMRLLHLIRQELVPESTVADVAELLTSGLFSLATDTGGTVELSLPEAVQRHLREDLAEHEVWRIGRALSRSVSAQANWGGQLPAVAHDPDSPVELPAEIRSFGQASRRTLEMMGLLTEESVRAGADRQKPAAVVVPALPSPPEREPTSDGRPYFFLSYAHTPGWDLASGDPDHWVRVFFRDLCDHVMTLTDVPAGVSAGFMDREMRPGFGWPQQLSENLASCQVFVPLLSPRYFTSESCGREWYAFAERMVQARATRSDAAPAIVPALWTPVDHDQLPHSVRNIRMGVENLGDRYEADGIYGLIKLNRWRDEYEETVLGLARRIVRVVHESPLPPGRPASYETTPSAFAPRGEGPRRIHLTVVAPTRDGIPEHRDARPYGADARDWNPYPSESPRPLVSLAEELIRSLDYRVTVSSFNEEEVDSLEQEQEGERKGGEVAPRILLIDRWALTDQELRRRLKVFDAHARPWVSAIVPWSGADSQCQGAAGRHVAEEMERTLPLILERGRRTDFRMAVNGVPRLKAFIDVLPAVVAHATRQYFRYADAYPPPAEPTPTPRLLDPAHPTYPEGGSDRGEGT